MKISRPLTVLLPLLALFLLSCSDSTILPSGDGTGRSAIPPVGATFTTNNVTVEENGTPIEATRHTITSTVSHLPEYNGRKEVAELAASLGDTMHVAYEENGDVALEYLLALSGKRAPVWLPLPVSSGVTVEEEIYRDTTSQGTLTTVTTAAVKMEQFGTETLVVGTETFQAIRIVGTITVTFENSESGQTTTSNMYVDFDISWILELGIYGRSMNGFRFDRAVPPQTTLHSTLIAFTLS